MRRKFTLPGEAGYETLTLELARRWGADVIRDSDGTALSDEILSTGYEIYSTICPIREHNQWLNDNLHARQQTFLSTPPVTATGELLEIRLMDAFFESQFSVNDSPDGLRYLQVYDRTQNVTMSEAKYSYENGVITIRSRPFRQYTVSFLAWRNWEEISMYNHTTNNWDKEKLMQLNPYSRGAMDYLRDWFINWCETHPDSNVVRFTSLFYNFAWIWGSNPRNRHLFTDWASYDFTVCPDALDDFREQYGYSLMAEDFVRQGKYSATHRVPSRQKREWMDFISAFVRRATRELVDIIHDAGKKAYVFYDDSWVGMEPYNGFFNEMKFDGLIKCVFSGYEARLCADVAVDVHEIRFHPYLFPVGLGGAPTFSPGGTPGADAMRYWVSVRRALLRKKIERTGLGGYLHLVQDYPDFVEAMDNILVEFDAVSALHDTGEPAALSPKIGILHGWGKMRSWTLSGHFHETDGHVLIHVLEALSGLPFDIKFLSFDDVSDGGLEGLDVIINAGEAGSVWSGGDYWEGSLVLEALSRFVFEGGVFLGIGEPSALPGYASFFRMANVLGVDLDDGERTCHGRWTFETEPVEGLLAEGFSLPARKGIILTDGNAKVIASSDETTPTATINSFGKGAGVYLSGFEISESATRSLMNLILYAAKGEVTEEGISDNPHVECAVFPEKIVFINNAETETTASCTWKGRKYGVRLLPYELKEENI